ncbi:hypothetical protein SAMN05421747_101169 [Parapedobacter composti]|uniref:Fibronectin type-III domain-containing protein n=1 Tax=Parapedobacter composti TaxID=623281 RepID=A0A1I1DXX2_9SPHI|nr:fibronectin type III domain-containing protein [Parapedobacter composti]SFB79657.1 hypothetical protein SAMN05421747_101169 [Parapedobacter composti]
MIRVCSFYLVNRCALLLLSLGTYIVGCTNKVSQSPTDDGEAPGTVVAVPTLANLGFTNITTTSARVTSNVTASGGSGVTARGVCWASHPDPTTDDAKAEAVTVSGSGAFTVHLEGLTQATTYYVRAYAVNSAGVGYSEEATFTTEAVQSVSFKNNPMFIIGSSRAAYDAEIISNGGGTITERGICWAANPDPTVDGHKVVHSSTGEGRYRCVITGLTERTDYYLRAYAVNEDGVSYGENIPFRTIARGNITYTFNKAANPTAEQVAAYERLQVAIDSAVWYANNYTSATKHVWVNYDPNVPTADANNEGWMRFGANAGFQNLRTMLHEMNHTFGTGTTNWWRNTAISGGKYQLPHANAVLKLITGNEDAQLNADNQHWWPYGLNQNSEVTSSWDYVYNCLIIEAMRKDGLTHSGTYLP